LIFSFSELIKVFGPAGKIIDFSNADVAVDQYHLFDVRLLMLIPHFSIVEQLKILLVDMKLDRSKYATALDKKKTQQLYHVFFTFMKHFTVEIDLSKQLTLWLLETGRHKTYEGYGNGRLQIFNFLVSNIS
jgi:hypothetical protein